MSADVVSLGELRAGTLTLHLSIHPFMPLPQLPRPSTLPHRPKPKQVGSVSRPTYGSRDPALRAARAGQSPGNLSDGPCK